MAQYIPDQTYVGARSPFTLERPPLAFLTPYGTDSAAKKRMSTVDKWVGGYGNKESQGTFQVLDNNPMSGFSIGEDVRRWSTDNVVWRINDPRGFQLEISSGNMAYLLAECTIEKGVVKDELQWCRSGADNYLLPTASAEYAKYTKNTAAINSNVTLKDIKAGDTIRLKDGFEGVYLGGYYIASFREYTRAGYRFIYVCRRHILRGTNGQWQDKSSLKDFVLIKQGADEDNRDYSSEIPLRSLSFSHPLYITQQVIKEEELLANVTLRPIKRPRINSSTQLGSFYVIEDKSDYLFRVRNYGGSLTVDEVNINLAENEFSTQGVMTPDRHSHNIYGRRNNYLTLSHSELLNMARSENIYAMFVTINGQDFVLTDQAQADVEVIVDGAVKTLDQLKFRSID